MTNWKSNYKLQGPIKNQIKTSRTKHVTFKKSSTNQKLNSNHQKCYFRT